MLSRWNPNKGKETVKATFDSHDFGMKWTYAEMAIAIRGLGLQWALDDLDDCLWDLIKMAGHPEPDTGNRMLTAVTHSDHFTSLPTKVTIGPAQDTDLPSASVDAIIFDPP